jgi:hypothetical protein
MLATVLAAGSSDRTLKTPPPSRPSNRHTTALRTRSRGWHPGIDQNGVVEHPAHSGRRHCPVIGAAILVQPSRNLGLALAKTAGGTPTLMRTGKRLSAETIMSRELPGILSSLFVLANDGTAARRCSEHNQTAGLKAPLPEARKPRSAPRSCSTLGSVSFEICRNRRRKLAVTQRRNGPARRQFVGRPCDTGDNQIRFCGRGG